MERLIDAGLTDPVELACKAQVSFQAAEAALARAAQAAATVARPALRLVVSREDWE